MQPTRNRIVATTVALVVAVASMVALGPTAAAAGAPAPGAAAPLDDWPANCLPATTGGNVTVTCTFGFTGATQTWSVPEGVRTIAVEVGGAQGGNGADNDQGDPGRGGYSAVVRANVAVSDGQVLDIVVGGQGGLGHDGGGWPDGGTGGSGGSRDRTGCGGGGRSSIGPADASWVVIAAGGGGCGGKAAGHYGVDGGAGGSPGQAAPDVAWQSGGAGCSAKGLPGAGATESGPGAAGAMGEYLSGVRCARGDTPRLSEAGNLSTQGRSGGQGGDAQGGAAGRAGGGGGGGGGYYGGGGGGGGNDSAGRFGGGGGGGGGRSYVTPTASITDIAAYTGWRAGSGQVTISYEIVTSQLALSLHPKVGDGFVAGSPATGLFFLDAEGDNHPSGDLNVTVGDRFGCTPTDLVAFSVPRWTSCDFTPVQAGSIPVTVTYAGNGGVQGSSATETITVAPMPTTTTITPTADRRTLTATVTGPGTGVAFDGVVDISANGSPLALCTGLVVTDNHDGTATADCDVERTVGSTNEYVATYHDGTDTAASTSLPYRDTVDRAASGTDVHLEATALSFGEAASATVTVTTLDGVQAAFDGTVDVTAATEGGTPITVCSAVPVDATGTARCSWQPGAGTHTVDAAFSGGTQLDASTSTTPATLTVAKADPTVVLTADPPGGATAGQTVTLHAAVDAVGRPVDGATATFTDDGTPIPGCGAVPVTAGAAQCSLVPAVGDHTFGVTTGATSDLHAATAPLSGASPVYPVGRRTSTTRIAMADPTPVPASIPAGRTVTATASVETPGSPVTGTVAFTDNGSDVPGCAARPLDSAGTATCTWTPAAGVAHQVNAAFAGNATTAPSASTTPVSFEVARHSATAALTATANGSSVTLAATITSPGPTPGGTVTFTDGGTVIAACGTRSAPEATCTYRASGGDHTYRAVYSGDTATEPATSPARTLNLPASATTLTASVRRAATGTLSTTATVTVPDDPAAVPTGTVTIGVGASSCTAALDPAPGGGATATCTIVADTGAPATVTAHYTPDDPTRYAASTGTVTYTPERACEPGIRALVAQLDGAGSLTVSAGDLGTVEIDADGVVGPCDGGTALDVTVDANLFGGSLTASGVSATIMPDGFCVHSGAFALPGAWRAPTITVTIPICFSVAANGTIDGIESGGLAGSFPAGRFLFVDLPDLPATSLSAGFRTEAGVTSLQLGVVAGPADAPVAALGLTVAADGTFSGTLTTPGLDVFDRSLADLSVAVSGGGGSPVRFDGHVTLTGIDLATGLGLSTVTVTVSDRGFAVSGTAQIGVAGRALELGFSGSIEDRANWSLALASSGGPAWEPLGGLSIRPDFSGSVTSRDGVVDWSATAGGSGLATWSPATGATFSIDSVALGNAPGSCPAAPSGSGDVVLDIAGALELGGIRVAVDGCADLTIGTFHWDATGRSVAVAPGMALTDLSLTVDGAVSGAFDVNGDATATVTAGGNTHTLAVTFAFGSDGTLVIGGSVDLGPWGAPVRGYVAYASSRVTGFWTGDSTVGRNGRIDLDAGLTAAAVWTPSPGTAEVLRRAGFTLGAGGTVELAATLAPGRAVTFRAALAAPGDVPFLRLPGGVTVTGAALDFADRVLTLVVDATVAMPGGAPAATVHLEGTIGDGTFTGTANVAGLVVFGQRVDLAGSLAATRVGGSLGVTASITGRIPGPIALPGAPDVTVRAVTLGLDGDGLAVSGTAEVAGRAGLTITGTLASVNQWSLTLRAATGTWTPAPGLTVTARLDGSLTRTAAGTTFEMTATGAGGALASFTPVGGFTVSVDAIRLGNSGGVPAGCTVTRPGNVWLYVNGSATLRIGAASGGATASGCFDLTSGTARLTADASAMRLSLLDGKVTISGPAVTVTRGASGYTVDASVDFAVTFPTGQSLRQTATLSLRSGGGFVVGMRANLSSVLGSAGGSAFVYYSSAPVRNFDTGDPSFGRVDLVAGITFAVKFTLPGNVARQLTSMGLTSPGGASVTAVGSADFSRRTYTLKILFDAGMSGQRLFTTGSGVSLTLDRGYVKVTVSGGSVAFGLGVDATLHTPAADRSGPASAVALNGEITISTSELKVMLQLGDCDSGEGWRDAFGVAGLTVQCAAVQGGVALTGPPLPTFGMMGTITSLPGDVADAIGFVNGSPISFAFNLDPFLLSISVGELDSDRVASRPLAMYGAPEAMEVTYAALYLSPTGATIGSQTYPAGIGFAFQASLGGVSTSVLAQIDLTVPRVVFDGRVGTITVGPLTLGPAAVHFEVSPRTFAFTFDGATALGPVEVDLGVVRIGGALSGNVHLGVAPSRIEAWVDARVSAYVATYLPHAACYYDGVVPYPCDWWWDRVGFDFTLGRTGFTLDSGGLVILFDGYSLTLPFDGSRPGVST